MLKDDLGEAAAPCSKHQRGYVADS